MNKTPTKLCEFRKLCPEGYIIFNELSKLSEIIADLDPDEAIRRMEEAESPLNALALEYPEAATWIFKNNPYFDEGIEDDEIYLGAGIICGRSELKKLDTPAKRAEFVKMCNED